MIKLIHFVKNARDTTVNFNVKQYNISFKYTADYLIVIKEALLVIS